MRLDFTENGSVSEDLRPLLEEAAEEARRPFVQMIDDLSRSNAGNLDWLFSGPASRNVFRSPLFFHCCRIVLLNKLLARSVSISGIVTDSPAMADLLRQGLRSRKRLIPVTLTGPDQWGWRRFLRRAGRFFGYTGIQLWSYLQARLTRRAGRPSRPCDPLTLVDTFVMSSFVETDRYYPGILEGLNREERDQIHFVPTLYRIGPRKVRTVFQRMRACGRKMIFKEDYLRLSDYFFALGHAFRLQRLKPGRVLFFGWDLSPLIDEEMRSLRSLGDTVIGWLNYRFAFRLKEAGMPLRLVIDWFENQVGDRGWNAGFHAAYPETPTVGYMGFVNTRYYLCARPTATEADFGLLPRHIAVMGNGLIRPVREFCATLRIETAPAYRFAHLHKERSMESAESDHSLRVLVALPFSDQEARRMLDLVGRAKSRLFKSTVFGVKFHPTTERTSCLRSLAEKKGIHSVAGRFDKLLQQSGVLVSTASSVCMEAIAQGVPVIVVGNPHGLTFNPIPDSVPRDLWRLVYDADEFVDAVGAFQHRDRDAVERRQSIGKGVRNNFFTAVSKAGTTAFLRMEPVVVK